MHVETIEFEGTKITITTFTGEEFEALADDHHGRPVLRVIRGGLADGAVGLPAA